MVNLLPFFLCPRIKRQSKIVGVARQQKKALRCAGYVWFVKAVTSILILLIDQGPSFPPQVTRLL
jgi:hypothetical protein